MKLQNSTSKILLKFMKIYINNINFFYFSNSLLQYVSKSLKSMSKNNKTKETYETSAESCNFLKDITDPLKGIQKLKEVCLQFPEGKVI